MLKSLMEVQSEREEREYMGHIDVEETNTRYLQTVNLNLEAANERLRADLRKANQEIERLKQHIRDLDHDLESTIKEYESRVNSQW